MSFSNNLNMFRVMAAGGMVIAGASGALALPVELTRAEFTAQTTGLPTIVENFEGFAGGFAAAPLVIANGTYTSLQPLITSLSAICGDTDNCVASQDPAPRGFSLFPTGTTFWGSDFNFVFGPTHAFDVTVVGVSGTTLFTHAPAGAFWGFTDPLGLVSISFARSAGVPTANFSFDNVTTAVGPAVSQVPEPATLMLLATGLAGLHWRRRTAAR